MKELTAYRKMLNRIAGVIFILAVVISMPASSDDLQMIARARAGIAELGKDFNLEIAIETRKVYTGLIDQVDTSGIKTIPDISYGKHDLQKLDLYVSENKSAEPGPVLLFLHGGGLNGGDKARSGSNVARFAARLGGIGLNANYRLTPEVKFPAGAEDIRAMLDWVKQNIRQYNGDPENIFLMGISAGAAIVAIYLFSEEFHYVNGPGIRGSILASGAFRSDDEQARVDYFGEDPDLRRQREPLGLVEGFKGKLAPVFLFSAEYDPTNIEFAVADMYARLCIKYNDCPMFTQFQGHNHLSTELSIDTADNEIANSLHYFMLQ